MQTAARHDVKQVVGCEDAIQRRLFMVTSRETLLLSARRAKDASLMVVLAVGEELEREERVGGAALAQVDLDGIDFPLVVVTAHHNEVEGETTKHALFGQALAHLFGLTQ